MGLQEAKLVIVSFEKHETIRALINPTEYTIERPVHYAELAVPGSQIPILQFVHGQAQTLTVELLLDRTKERKSIDGDLKTLGKLVTIHPKLHAPPVCRFEWGQGPGGQQSADSGKESQERFFTGVVTSLKENRTLFDEEGHVLRAKVTVTLKSYRSSEAQSRDTKTSSPDRTRMRVLREGETLSQLANEAYGDPRLWREIAEANGIDRPRFIPPGTPLQIPSV